MRARRSPVLAPQRNVTSSAPGTGSVSNSASKRMGDEALVDGQHVVAAIDAETEPPAGGDAQTDRGAKAPLGKRRPGRDHGVGQTTGTSECFTNNGQLQLDLGRRLTCCQPQPPQPAATNRQGGDWRSGDVSSTSSTSAPTRNPSARRTVPPERARQAERPGRTRRVRRPPARGRHRPPRRARWSGRSGPRRCERR